MRSPYELLVAAANALVSVELLSKDRGTPAGAAHTYLAANRVHLEAARSVLGPDCCVLLTNDISFFPEHAKAFTPLRNLAQSFGLELQEAAVEEDYVKAASIAVDIL